MLFEIYINDFLFKLDKGNPHLVLAKKSIWPVSCLAYAGETLILAKPTVFALQKMLDSVRSFCDRWNMTINTTKIKCVTFQNRHRMDKMMFLLFVVSLWGT